MNKSSYILFLIVIIYFFACSPDEPIGSNSQNPPVQNCAYENIDNAIWSEAGQTWLYGGTVDSMHFDITDWTLNGCQLGYGLGREEFQALITPKYTPIDQVNNILPSEKCIVLHTPEAIKVYPYAILNFHEAVNERVGDVPITIAFCKLADLAVVYDRTFCQTEVTFAISGYTYSDPAIYDNTVSFILWDRETESLWWPLADIAVSGFFKGTSLRKFNEDLWEQMLWEDILVEHPEAIMLAVQTQATPDGNFKIETESLDCM